MKEKKRIDELWLVLIVVLIATAAVILEKKYAKEEVKATQVSEKILSNLVVNDAQGRIIDEKKLEMLRSMDYDDLKTALQIEKDFALCIKDADGNRILLKGADTLRNEEIVCD